MKSFAVRRIFLMRGVEAQLVGQNGERAADVQGVFAAVQRDADRLVAPFHGFRGKPEPLVAQHHRAGEPPLETFHRGRVGHGFEGVTDHTALPERGYFVRNLSASYEIEDLSTVDLAKATENYLLSIGLTADEVTALRARLSGE